MPEYEKYNGNKGEEDSTWHVALGFLIDLTVAKHENEGEVTFEELAEKHDATLNFVADAMEDLSDYVPMVFVVYRNDNNEVTAGNVRLLGEDEKSIPPWS